MVGPLKTYCIYCAGAILGRLRGGRATHVFLNAFWTQTVCMFFTTVADSGPETDPNWTEICGKMIHFLNRFPQSDPTGPRGGSRPLKRHQNGVQWCQNGAPRPPKLRFWNQTCDQKGPRVLSFQMVKKATRLSASPLV